MQISNRTLIALIVLLLPLSLFYGSNMMELRAEEPRRAIVSIEMLLTGNYLVPKINGWDYYNKPPLFNWMMVGCFYLFQSFSEWVVRFPSILSFLLTGAFHYFFAKKYLGKQTALLASLFFLTSADIFFYATINAGEIDLFYTLLVYLQLMCIFIFYERKDFLLLFLTSYFFTALGVLTKGPPSLAFQAITLLAWFIYNGNFKKLFGWQHICGIAFCVLISGGYFYLYSQHADVWGMITRLTKEATQRSGMESGFMKTVLGTVSFPFLLFRLLLPWSVFIFLFFRKDFLQRLKENRLVVFCALFVVCNIPIYWFTGELKNRYIYMFFPFMLTVVAYFLKQRETRYEKIYTPLQKLFLVAFVLCGIAFLSLPLIPCTKTIPSVFAKSILFSICSFVIAYGYFKNVSQRILWIVLFLAMMRFGVDMFYYPAMMSNSPDLAYRQKAEDILRIANGEQIFFADNPYNFKSDFGVGPFKLGEREHTTAALIAYEVPYYITRSNKQIMQFETEIKPGKLYITTQQFAEEKNVERLYQLHDNWLQNELLLVRGR